MNGFVRNHFRNLALDIFKNVQSLGDAVILSSVNALCTIMIRPVTWLTAQHQWSDVVGQTFVIRRWQSVGLGCFTTQGVLAFARHCTGLLTLYFVGGLRAR